MTFAMSLGKALFFYLCLHLALSSANRPESRIHVKNITYLGPQINPELPGLSRDGGASVLLNDHVVWLFDDTQITSNTSELLFFVSNTAAYSHAPDRNLALLQDFGIPVPARLSGTGDVQTLTVDESLSAGGWIPFTKDELSFNGQDPGKARVAICR